MFFQGYVLLLEWLVVQYVHLYTVVWLSSGNAFVDGVQGSHTYHSYNVYIRKHTSTHIQIDTHVMHALCNNIHTCAHTYTHTTHTHAHTHTHLGYTQVNTQAQNQHIVQAHKICMHAHTHNIHHVMHTQHNARTQAQIHTYICHKVLKRCTLTYLHLYLQANVQAHTIVQACMHAYRYTCTHIHI